MEKYRNELVSQGKLQVDVQQLVSSVKHFMRSSDVLRSFAFLFKTRKCVVDVEECCKMKNVMIEVKARWSQRGPEQQLEFVLVAISDRSGMFPIKALHAESCQHETKKGMQSCFWKFNTLMVFLKGKEIWYSKNFPENYLQKTSKQSSNTLNWLSWNSLKEFY